MLTTRVEYVPHRASPGGWGGAGMLKHVLMIRWVLKTKKGGK